MRYTLTQWTKPSEYIGSEFIGYYTTGLSRTFKSCVSLIDTANCRAFLELYGDYADEYLFGSWATDFYEIFVRPDTPREILDQIQETLDALHDYPLISDDIYSQLEEEARSESIDEFILDYERSEDLALNDDQKAMISEYFYQYGEICEDYCYLGRQIEEELKAMLQDAAA